MPQDYLAPFFAAVTDFLTQYASTFEAMGVGLFHSFALFVISWFGIQVALSGQGFPWSKFTALLHQLLICYVMVSFYTVPIPGFNISFSHLILDQAQSLTGAINQGRVQEIVASLNDMESNLAYPTLLEPISIIRFIILVLCIAGAQAVTLSVIMFGYIATAVILILGPVFIPFKIFPEMEWMFWGWLRSFIQYSFYQVIAAAYVFMFGKFLIQFLGTISGPMSGPTAGVMFRVLSARVRKCLLVRARCRFISFRA